MDEHHKYLRFSLWKRRQRAVGVSSWKHYNMWGLRWLRWLRDEGYNWCKETFSQFCEEEVVERGLTFSNVNHLRSHCRAMYLQGSAQFQRIPFLTLLSAPTGDSS